MLVSMSSCNAPVVHRLGNGLTVLIKEDRSHPVVSLQYWVGTGSMNEGHLQGSGISHLLEHLVFKGTKSYTCQELAQKVQERGGHWNAYTSTNRTVFYIDGPSESWQTFLNILTELVFKPTFPESEFEREKDVVRREMDMYADDPDSVAYELLMKTLYLKHPQRWPVLGELACFNAVTLSDVLDYHACRYVPNNVTLVIAGAVNPAEALAHLEQLTEGIKARSIEKEVLPTESHQFGSRTARKEFAVPYSKLYLAWRLPKSSHPDAPALSVLPRILGGGRSAVFYEKFHDRLGLLYNINVSANLVTDRDGVFIVTADVERERRDQVRDLILQEFREIGATDFTEDLKRVCKQTKVGRLRRRGTASGQASGMGSDWFAYRNLNHGEEWQEAIERVTTADLHRACAAWLTAPTLTEVSLDPQGSNGAEQTASAELQAAAVHEATLSNGLKVVVREDGRLPLVYACMAFKAGCPAEHEGNAGVTDLMSECLLKGTSSRSATEIARYLENIGGSINTSAGNNSLSIGCHTLAEDLECGLELMADVAMNPTFPQEAFLREKEAFIAEAQEMLEDPLHVAFREERRVAYGNVSYGNSPSGTPQSLASLSLEDVRAQYERIVCAANAALCITGDVKMAEVLPLLEKHLGGMRRGSVPELAATPNRRGGRKETLMDKQQAVMALAVPGAKVTDDELHLGMLFNSWCGDMAGPIFTGIREEAGLAYYASSTAFIGLDSGSFRFYLGTSPEQLNDAEQRLLETLNAIYENGMSAEELERTRASLLSSRLLSMQSNGALSQMMALDTLFGQPADTSERLTQAIRETTTEEINAYIKKTLAPERPRSVSIVKPGE